MGWIDEVRGLPVEDVARRLGLVGRRGPRRGLGPCPACDARQRSRKDKRGPIGIARDGAGWACHRCEAKGDALDLVAWCLCRGRLADLTMEERAEVRGWLVDHGYVVTHTGDARTRPRPRSGPALGTDAANVDREGRPPGHEIGDLWDRALAVTEDTEVDAWVRSRELSPGRVEDLDLARVLPRDGTPPRWAWMGGLPWAESGHRLLLPLWDHRGRLTSLHARLVRETEAPKAVSPTGFAAVGLLLADSTALHLLRGGLPPGWTSPAAGEVFVTEGVPDYVTWATHWGDAAEVVPAVLGVIGAGSWREDSPVAAVLPDNCVVTIATHTDEAGEGYAKAIKASVASRCRVRRLVP